MDLVAVLALATFVEGVIQYIKKSFSVWSFAALGLGLLIAYGAGLDVVQNGLLGADVHFPWWLGQALTGLSLGFGSSFIHDFIATKRSA